MAGRVKAVLTRFPFWESAPLCVVEHESLFWGVISAKRPPCVWLMHQISAPGQNRNDCFPRACGFGKNPQICPVFRENDFSRRLAALIQSNPIQSNTAHQLHKILHGHSSQKRNDEQGAFFCVCLQSQFAIAALYFSLTLVQPRFRTSSAPAPAESSRIRYRQFWRYLLAVPHGTKRSSRWIVLKSVTETQKENAPAFV